MNCDKCPLNTNGKTCGSSKFYNGAVGVSCKSLMDYLERKKVLEVKK